MQKSPKIRHLHTIAQLCRAVSSQLRHVSTIGKKLVKQQYLLHMSPQYGKLWPTKGRDRFGSFGHPSEFQRVWRLALVTAAMSLTGGQPNFARCLAIWYTIYTLFGVLAPTEFCLEQNSLYVKSCVILYWKHHCTALQQRASAKLCSVVQEIEFQNLCTERHLYLARRPSR